jgi:hypothetical protein
MSYECTKYLSAFINLGDSAAVRMDAVAGSRESEFRANQSLPQRAWMRLFLGVFARVQSAGRIEIDPFVDAASVCGPSSWLGQRQLSKD